MLTTRQAKCGTCGELREVVDGAWLRGKRNGAKLSLSQMAKRAKVSKTFVSAIERNLYVAPARVVRVYEKLKQAA